MNVRLFLITSLIFVPVFGVKTPYEQLEEIKGEIIRIAIKQLRVNYADSALINSKVNSGQKPDNQVCLYEKILDTCKKEKAALLMKYDTIRSTALKSHNPIRIAHAEQPVVEGKMALLPSVSMLPIPVPFKRPSKL